MCRDYREALCINGYRDAVVARIPVLAIFDNFAFLVSNEFFAPFDNIDTIRSYVFLNSVITELCCVNPINICEQFIAMIG